MTESKSRVQLALELADALPAIPGEPATRNWGGTDADQVGTELMKGGLTSLAIALANVLLRLVERDEREASLHPIARANHTGVIQTAPTCSGPDVCGGWCHKHYPDVAPIVHPAPTSPPSEDKPTHTCINTATTVDGSVPPPCPACMAASLPLPRGHHEIMSEARIRTIQRLVGERSELEVLHQAYSEKIAHFNDLTAKHAEAQAELTRLKVENARLSGERDQWESACSVAMAHNDRMAAEAEATIAGLEAETMTLTSERDTARMTQDELRAELGETQETLANLRRDTRDYFASEPLMLTQEDQPHPEPPAERPVVPAEWGPRLTVACCDCGAAYQNTHRKSCPVGRDPARSVTERNDDCMPDPPIDPRPIAIGSTWSHKLDGYEVEVRGTDNGVRVQVVSLVGATQWWAIEEFRAEFVWVRER